MNEATKHADASQCLHEAFGEVAASIHADQTAPLPLRAPGGVHGAVGICAAVAVVLCLQELDRAKALECLPTPGALLAQLRARAADFDLLAGVAAAYLHERGIASAYEVR